jgi:arsenate reductase
MKIAIHHNPACGTSRNVLQIIRDAGYEPDVIEYLNVGWTRPQLLALFAAANLTPRTALRTTKSPAAELGLLEDGISDDEILAQMLEYPVLVNRPIVACKNGVRLCRPSEAVLDLLDNWPDGPWVKEEGQLVIDAEGKRV